MAGAESAVSGEGIGEIRVLGDEDGEQVLTLVKNMLLTYGFRWDPDGDDADVLEPRRYVEEGGTFLVLVRDGHIMGTLAARKLDNRRLELRRMYLHPALWGEGWGSRLFDRLSDWAVAHEFVRLELEADPRFDRSIGFYESKGFRRMPEASGGGQGPLRYAMNLPQG
ncbi:MAG: GNAT family N-acetyltransferase [Candidatus Sericytochromatia bacterium]|nr:GNAT family N-acetyltransferase [Candidatus Sericytochromatia bacterium]